ncbi:MAG: response regulator transcription factor [Bacteroidetes bacterium]|nr:response regulator transcription factor [Bacteroidota bacterium]
MKVFITDDHEMYLEGLALLLNKQIGITVAGTAMSGTELLQKLPQIDADILLLDVYLPDIKEEALLKKIREIRPKQKVLCLTLLRGTRHVHKLVKLGIEGYILKSASVAELTTALQKVHEGGQYLSKEINIGDVQQNSRGKVFVADKDINDLLSKREQEVLRLVCKEYNNAEIAKKLFLSVSTIETHRKNIIAKLGVNNTVGLVKFAVKHQLAD